MPPDEGGSVSGWPSFGKLVDGGLVVAGSALPKSTEGLKDGLIVGAGDESTGCKLGDTIGLLLGAAVGGATGKTLGSALGLSDKEGNEVGCGLGILPPDEERLGDVEGLVDVVGDELVC